MNKVVILASSVLLCVHMVYSNVTIVFMCDKDVMMQCETLIDTHQPNITCLLVRPSHSYISNLRLLNNTVVENQSIGVLIGFGGDQIVNAVATVGMETNIATITYTTSRHRKTLYSDYVISISPDREGLARAITTLVSSKMLAYAMVMCEDQLFGDGLMFIFRDNGVNNSHTMSVSGNDNDDILRLKLLHIHDIGVRLIILHVSETLLDRLIGIAEALSYFDVGYAWIITEEGLPSQPHLFPGIFPPGLLAVEGYEQDRYEDILHALVKAVMEEINQITINADRCGQTMAEGFQNWTAQTSVFKKFVRGLRTNPHLFDRAGDRPDMQFRLLNYIVDTVTQKPEWKTVGLIKGPELHLDSVVWPGPSIFGPIQHARQFYTIVTKPAEPFIYIRGPVKSHDECKVHSVCLQTKTEDVVSTKVAIELFLDGQQDHDNFSIYCCEGLVVDLLHSLSVELRFDFLLYFKENDDYGDYVNGTWTGLLGDVNNGAADILAGAISITSERMSAVTFTESFYYSSFNMIAARERPYTTLWAFTRPFDTYVWVLIIISATTVAIATALYEWNSPFGLNPWGKKRKRNYTLGSALNMVYSLWYGHTVNTKSPKSWPSKVLQNFWAATAIFITAGYTANLAAFLAGNAYRDAIFSILDTQLTSKRVGVVPSSAVEEYTKALNAGLHTRFLRNYVRDAREGIVKIRQGELHMYMDDTPLLEYALASYDTNCTLKYAAHSFGENSYAFAMKKGSWLKTQFDPLILNYVELGVIDNLKWRYMGKPRQCENKLMSKDELGFGLDNTGGLFIMLLIGCGISILLLIGEYIIYFLVLPRLRNKPDKSIWKNRHLEFFSQRLYRSINSEKVKQPAQALVSKVRRKKFELQSHINSAHNRLHRQSHSVPAALQSYQFTQQTINTISNMTFPDMELYEDFSVHHGSDGAVYTISGNTIREEPSSQNQLVQFHHSMSSPLLTTSRESKSTCFINPIFEADEEQTNTSIPKVASNQPVLSGISRVECKNIQSTLKVEGEMVPSAHEFHERLETSHPQPSMYQQTQRNMNLGMDNGVVINELIKETKVKNQTRPSQCGLCKTKRYETWPSPKTRKRSTKHRQNNNNITRSTREQLTDSKRIVNHLPRRKCRTCSLSSRDSYHGNHGLEMKDNRMKSNLRDHAMGSMPRSPSISLDDGAVQALSKEDLLVLWKKSEIELQTKLNKMLHQNNHLRHLVDIAEQEAESRQQNTVASEQQTTSTSSSFKCSRL